MRTKRERKGVTTYSRSHPSTRSKGRPQDGLETPKKRVRGPIILMASSGHV